MKNKFNARVIEATASEFSTSTEIFGHNCFIKEVGTGKLKIGDAATQLKDLPSIGGGGGGGGSLPAITERDVYTGDANGNLVAKPLGWRQFSDLPTPPPFSNGVLTGTAFNAQGNALFAFLELAMDAQNESVAKPNAIPFYQPGTPGEGGGTLPVQNAVNDNDAVNLGQMNTALPKPSTVAPIAAGAAAVGTSALYARQDHRHPLQTTVSGKAGSADVLTAGRTFDFAGGATGRSAPFNGSENLVINLTLADPTATVRGGVLQQSAIADVSGRPLDESDYNALLAALRGSGLLSI